jgi:hypothetical protein
MTYGTRTNLRSAIARMEEQTRQDIAKQERMESRLIWTANIFLAGVLIAGHIMGGTF